MNSVGIGCCGQELSVDHPYPVGWVGDGQGRGRPDQAGGYAAWSCGGLGYGTSRLVHPVPSRPGVVGSGQAGWYTRSLAGREMSHWTGHLSP